MRESPLYYITYEVAKRCLGFETFFLKVWDHCVFDEIFDFVIGHFYPIPDPSPNGEGSAANSVSLFVQSKATPFEENSERVKKEIRLWRIKGGKKVYIYFVKINRTIQAEFFYGASPAIFERARELRKNMTEAEKTLWKKINEKQINGWQFRRQHPISHFIADFYCHAARLVIEVDGGIHNADEQKEKDKARNFFMTELGLTVFRLTNEEVENELERVVEKIASFIPSPRTSPIGEGSR